MARRITGPTINWTAIAERVPEGEKHLYVAFKTKSDQYLRRMVANPESFPKIDWGYYKKNVAIAGMVDKFQKEYDALKISYPVDKYTSAVDAQEKEIQAGIKQFAEQSNERIKKYEAEITKVKSLLPFEEMTMEDYKDAYPELALNPLENPTFWPHDADEKLQEGELDKKPEH